MSDDGRADESTDPAGDDDTDRDAGSPHRTVAQGQDATTETSEEGRDDEEEWRYSLDDLPIDGEEGDEGEGIAGVFGPSKEIEPEAISRESVVFVVLGAVIALVGLYLMLP